MIDLSGMMVIKNASPEKQKKKKNSYPLPGIHEGGGIDACQKKRKKRQKNCGNKHRPFFSAHKIWPSPGPKEVNKMIDLFKNVFWDIIEGAFIVLLHMLKYFPGTQEAYKEEVARH